jgi:WD40 repeat protein
MSPGSSVSLPNRAPGLCWSLGVSGAVRGLSLARERGWVLVRDEHGWLYLLDHAGARQAQHQAPKELAASACADDGSAYAAAAKEGDVWWLAPDLMPRWQRSPGQRVEGLAVDPLGRYLAVAASAGVTLLTREGKTIWQTETPRPLRHLAFVPEKPFLLGAADFGLVVCLDATNGKLIWRDGLVANVGSLATNGDGSAVVLACYSDGLCRYALGGPPPERQPLSEPCRAACLSYDGRLILAAGLGREIRLLDHRARTRGEHRPESSATALVLSPLGDRMVVGTATGQVSCLKWG